MIKDNFSIQSENYKKYRPTYPQELYDFLYSIVPEKQNAWDCGTGNGQVAHQLAKVFENVFATDISRQQIEKALANPKIHYSVQEAEKTTFPENTFDLITVAQAIHWFEFDQFYEEVNRTLKRSGILAVIGYGLIQTFKEANKLIIDLYNILRPFWDKERKFIDENYQTIPFPFKEIEAPELQINCDWTFEHLINYLGTWSAVQHYKKKLNQDPIKLIYEDLIESWGMIEERKVVFPVFLRIGKGD